MASELGAEVTGDVSELAEAQQVDTVVEALASLLVAIVQRRPFDRRNNAVGVASIDVLARLNGQTLDLAPPQDVKAMIAKVQDGLGAMEVRDWLRSRITRAVPVARPRCPACGGCGHLLSGSVHRRSRQEA